MLQRGAARLPAVWTARRLGAVVAVAALVAAAGGAGEAAGRGGRTAPARRAGAGYRAGTERTDTEHQVAEAHMERVAAAGAARLGGGAGGRDSGGRAAAAQSGADRSGGVESGAVPSGAGASGLERLGGVRADVLVTATDGYRGDVLIDGVSLGAGFVLRQFVGATRARSVQVDGPADAVRLVRGPKANASTPTMTLGMFDDAPGLLSREDLTRAAPSVASALTSTNLNQCVDIDRACTFSFDVVFDGPLTDNNAGDDALPELLFFQRAGGAAGSVAVVALDAEGEETGRAVVLGAEGLHECTPRAAAAVFDRRLQVTGYGSVGFVALDLSTLGVAGARTVRVRTPRAGDRTLDGGAWSGDAGQPDFKLVGVRTDVTLPAWMIGD